MEVALFAMIELAVLCYHQRERSANIFLCKNMEVLESFYEFFITSV